MINYTKHFGLVSSEMATIDGNWIILTSLLAKINLWLQGVTESPSGCTITFLDFSAQKDFSYETAAKENLKTSSAFF